MQGRKRSAPATPECARLHVRVSQVPLGSQLSVLVVALVATTWHNVGAVFGHANTTVFGKGDYDVLSFATTL